MQKYNKFYNQKEGEKKHLQANGFKGLEKIRKVTSWEEPLVGQTWDQTIWTIKRKVGEKGV